MNRQKAWWGAVAAAAGLIFLTAWIPGYRLQRELAAARAEGLWTEPDDIRRAIRSMRPGENAGPLMRTAIAQGKTVNWPPKESDADGRKLNRGAANPVEKKRLLRALAERPDLVAQWRKISRCPHLDFDRKWEDGLGVLLPEYAEVRRVARVFVANATLGVDPKENLLVAARISVLIRQEPNLIAQLVSVSIGKTCLRQAKAKGLGKEIEAALGDPIDVRWAYAAELPLDLTTLSWLGTPEWSQKMGVTNVEEGFWQKLKNAGPGKANRQRELVAHFRALYRALPKETDYDSASRAVDRWMPLIDRDLAEASPVIGMLLGGDGVPSQGIQAFKTFEEERKAVREGREIPSEKTR